MKTWEDTTIGGCFFHFSQNLFKHLGKSHSTVFKVIKHFQLEQNYCEFRKAQADGGLVVKFKRNKQIEKDLKIKELVSNFDGSSLRKINSYLNSFTSIL